MASTPSSPMDSPRVPGQHPVRDPPGLETTRRLFRDPTPLTSPIEGPEKHAYEVRLAEDGSTHIRLMELLPGSGSDPLTCNFHVVSLDSDLDYETISYCWGESILDAQLVVKDKGLIAITTTLQNALLQLRYTDKPRLFWADVVCVNQEDIEERTVQVQLMHRIYQQCQQVLIWLGDGTEQSYLGMTTINAMKSALSKKRAAGDTRLLYDLSAADITRYGLYDSRSPEIRAMMSLMKRPWFTRSWIVQEAAWPLAAVLMCGSKSVPWDDFAFVMTTFSPSLKKFSTNEDPGENQFRLSICPSREEAQARDLNPPELVRLVARNRNAEATDPRDKIFAFIGLGRERGHHSILGQPDYRRTTEDVFKEFVLRNISRYHTLDVLSLVHGRFMEDVPSVPALSLPSWVPDLSVNGIPYPLTRLDKFDLQSHATLRTKSDYLHYEASGRTEVSYGITDDGARLTLSGYVFDTVGQELGLPFPGRSEWSNEWKKLQSQRNAWASWEAIVGTRRGTMYGNETAYDVYWKVMRGGELEKHLEVARNDFRAGYERPLAPYRLISFGQVVRSTLLFRGLYSVSCRILDIQNYIRRLSGKPTIDYTRGIGTNISEYRKMGKSSSGAVCMLPGAAMAGDSIALLQGGRVPYILRPNGNNWQLVGEAYVHGIMEGEAWDSGKCEKLCLV